MGQYSEVIKELRASFASGRTKSYEWRIEQLTALMSMLKDNEATILEALHKDLHKPKSEGSALDINVSITDIVTAVNNLASWMKPQKVEKDSAYIMDTAYVQNEPLGVTLIIGAWNYPIQLALIPLIGAIAAGNCCILKPSEVSENAAKFLEEFIPKYLDTDCIRVINGGVPETTELLHEKYDLIFYTGNGVVGRIILAAAAKHLTPVILELGGKSPVYIDDTVDMKTASQRLAWGKCINAGQTCIAPDYILCTPFVQAQLIASLKETIKEFYTDDPQKSNSFTRIINERHFKRIKKLKDNCRIAIGGEDDEADLYMAPTVLRDVALTDPIMQEEIFGPLLPIVTVKNVNEALDIINSRDKPLALYVFSHDKSTIASFRDKTSSGALLINDTIMHAAINSLPFGGIGASGMGAYHGKHSYNAFSHSKPVLVRSFALENLNQLRYPPYSEKKLNWMNWLLGKKLNKRRSKMAVIPYFCIGTIICVLAMSRYNRFPALSSLKWQAVV